MAETIKQEQFNRDPASGASYVRFTEQPVAYTLRIEEKDDFFLADYDAAGHVRGIEFLGRRAGTIDHYRAVATQKSQGPRMREPRDKRLAG